MCEVNINECESAPCLNGGTCNDMVAGYECKCPDGIRGEQCEIDDDDCASGPCQNDGACKDSSGKFKYVFNFFQVMEVAFSSLIHLYSIMILLKVECSSLWGLWVRMGLLLNPKVPSIIINGLCTRKNILFDN
jgi:hypothetical protein